MLHELYLAALRVGADPVLAKTMMGEPLLFAAHYAIIVPLIDWPAGIKKEQEAVERRYQRHDKVLALINSLREQVPIALSADLAVKVAEGLEIHRHFRWQLADYNRLCARSMDAVKIESDIAASSSKHSVAGRLSMLTRCMDFDPVEHGLLAYALSYSIVPSLQLLTRLFMQQPSIRQSYWCAALAATSPDIAKVLSPQGRLIGSGMIRSACGIPMLSDFWVELLLKAGNPFADSLFRQMPAKVSPGGVARLHDDDQNILRALVQAQTPGANALLFGKPGVDKQSLAYKLICEADAVPFTLAPDIPDGDLPVAVIVAQRMLAEQTGSVLVIQNAAAVLTRTLPDLSFLFGGVLNMDDEAKPLDELILTENPIPTLWLTNDPQRLHTETLARFLFHAEAMKGARADRKALVEAMIAALPLSETDKAELIKLEGLSEQQLRSSLCLAELTAVHSKKHFARHLVIAATRSQKALARRDKDEARLPITHYSLDYINYAGRFGPAQISSRRSSGSRREAFVSTDCPVPEKRSSLNTLPWNLASPY